MPAYSPKLDLALVVSAIVHRLQHRKGTRIPYVMHPFQVALILDRHGFGSTLVEAAALHDVLEDIAADDPELQRDLRQTFPAALADAPWTPGAFKERVRALLLAEFGPEVVALVDAVTEDKVTAQGEPIPWPERKHLALERLRRPAVPDEVFALKAADVLHNVRSLERDVRRDGPQAFDGFRADPEDSLRYYARVARLASIRLGERQPLALEACSAVVALAEALDAAGGHAGARHVALVRQVNEGTGA